MSIDVDRVIATLARHAAAADNGVNAGACGLVDLSVQRFHEGSAKAYRHAIKMLIDNQRLIRSQARSREQCASCTTTSNDPPCVSLVNDSDPRVSSAPDTMSPRAAS